MDDLLAKALLTEAAKREQRLDHESYFHDMDVDKAMDRWSEIEDLYRRGFQAAQRVGGDFYERMAEAHGFATPLARTRNGWERELGRDIEDLEIGLEL